MVTKAFWNQTAFHFWIRNWQISPGCDWKWHWTFKAMMVKLDFQGWEVLPMFRDLLAYFCTNSLRYQRIFLQAVQKDNGDIWQYALVPRRKSKAETFWHLSQCQEINQWFTWEFSCDEQASLISLFLSPFSWQLASSGRFLQRAAAGFCQEFITIKNPPGGGFKDFLFSPLYLGKIPIWLIFFKGIETTN